MLSRKSKKNVESLYAIMCRRNLENDIGDLDEFVSTYLFEDSGLVRRREISNDYLSNHSGMCVSSVLLANYPLGQMKVELAVPLELPAPVYSYCEIEKVKSYDPEYIVQRIGVRNSDVKQEDMFFAPPIKREIGRLSDGDYVCEETVVSITKCKSPEIIVEMWDGKIHDVLKYAGDNVMTKPYSYRRFLIEDSPYAFLMTQPISRAHMVICVTEDIYQPDGFGSYFEILDSIVYRLRAGQKGWVAGSVGAGTTPYVLVKEMPMVKAGCFLVDADYAPRGPSSWMHSILDVEESRKVKDFNYLYSKCLEERVEQEGMYLSVSYSGNVTDVGMRYAIWQVSTKYKCMGRVYNKEDRVFVEVCVPLYGLVDYKFALGGISILFHAEMSLIEEGHVTIPRSGRFFIVRSYHQEYPLDLPYPLLPNAAFKGKAVRRYVKKKKIEEEDDVLSSLINLKK